MRCRASLVLATVSTLTAFGSTSPSGGPRAAGSLLPASVDMGYPAIASSPATPNA